MWSNKFKAVQVKGTIAITGPGISRKDILSTIQNWNNMMKSGEGCIILGPLPSSIPPDWSEEKVYSPSNGYASFTNTDAGNYTDDNAQSVNFRAPKKIGNKQDEFSVLLNNVVPDSVVDFFFQNGILFKNGKGTVVWTDTLYGLAGQPYNVPYKSGHGYYATITFTGGVWQMCMGDTDIPGAYQCIIESHAPGTSLKLDRNTGVWLENRNSRSNWYSRFSTPISVSGAYIYGNGVGQTWLSQSRNTSDACQTAWPATNAISGSLTGGQIGYFHLEGIPLYC